VRKQRQPGIAVTKPIQTLCGELYGERSEISRLQGCCGDEPGRPDREKSVADCWLEGPEIELNCLTTADEHLIRS